MHDQPQLFSRQGIASDFTPSFFPRLAPTVGALERVSSYGDSAALDALYLIAGAARVDAIYGMMRLWQLEQ